MLVFPKKSREKSLYFNLFIMGVGSGLGTEIEISQLKTTEIEVMWIRIHFYYDNKLPHLSGFI